MFLLLVTLVLLVVYGPVLSLHYELATPLVLFLVPLNTYCLYRYVRDTLKCKGTLWRFVALYVSTWHVISALGYTLYRWNASFFVGPTALSSSSSYHLFVADFLPLGLQFFSPISVVGVSVSSGFILPALWIIYSTISSMALIGIGLAALLNRRNII